MAVSCLMIVFGVLSITGYKENATYRHLRRYADRIKVIDTHEHQQMFKATGDQSAGLAHLIRSSYLLADIWSSGVVIHDSQNHGTECNDTIWKLYGKYLDFTRNTSYYRQLLRGFNKLYGFKDISFTQENTDALSEQIGKNYNRYPEWFDYAFNKAGYDLMFVHQYWAPFNTDVDKRYFALAFDVNALIAQVSHKPESTAPPLFFYKEAFDAGFRIVQLDDYLLFCDFLFKKNVDNKAVCIKNSLAYSRTIYFEDVSYQEAKALFEKKSSELSDHEAKKLEDYMFHWIIRKSIEYDLPIQIHTGYLAGNGNTLDNGYPLKLNNLFLQYPDAKFVLFHGGFPWTGEYTALGKMFRNVYLDLVWLPQISREEAVNALDVILDCVPYNKIFWGGDCKFIEESVGSLEYGKDIVAEVLARRVNRGVMTRQVACEIMERIFRINAIEVFALEDILGLKNEYNPIQN